MNNSLDGMGKNISIYDIKKEVDATNENFKIIEPIVNSIVDSCCKELNEKMKEFKEVVTNKKRDLTDEELDYMIMELPCFIYFVSDEQENMGLKGDLSNMRVKELYNRVYLETLGKTTEKTNAAELSTQERVIATEIINSAYKKIKLKVDAAFELVSSLKKVISRRIATSEYSGGEDE